MRASRTDATAKIAAAHDLAHHRDAAAVLTLLVEAWRIVADRVLAEAIQRIGPHAARGRGLPIASDDSDRNATWLAATQHDDAGLRGVLVSTAREGAVSVRIEALSRHRDPRITDLVVKLLLEPDSAGIAFIASRWVPLTKALIACCDPRAVAQVPEILANWQTGYGSSTERAAHARRLAKFAERMADQPVTDLDGLASEHARIAEIVALVTRDDHAAANAVTEESLLAAIYAAPADDAPRAVYADWLLERNDPRGELIAMQLQPQHDRMRAYSLYTTHRDRVLGSLAPYIEKAELERGFVATCTPTFEDAKIPPADPAWATVREIVRVVPATDACPMPILTTARHLGPVALAHLATLASPPPIARLGVFAGLGNEMSLAIAAFERLHLPQLRALEIEGYSDDWQTIGPDRMPWPWQPLGLEELAVPTGLAHLGAWYHALVAARLERLVLSVHGYGSWTIRMTADSFHATCDWRFARELEPIAAAIVEYRPGTLARCEIHVHAKSWNLPARRVVALALARHPGVAIDIPGYSPPRR